MISFEKETTLRSLNGGSSQVYLIMMKPHLFIDFDGTLCHDKFWRSSPTQFQELIQSFLFQENTDLINKWMRGYYTSEQINQLVADKISVDRNWLWNIFVDDCKTMRVSSDTLEMISLLRNKFSVVLITGNMDCFDRFTVPSLKLDKYFDLIVNSYNERMLKDENNGLTFSKLAGNTIKSSILIDDSEKVCKMFTSLGGTALQVTPAKNIDYYLKTI